MELPQPGVPQCNLGTRGPVADLFHRSVPRFTTNPQRAIRHPSLSKDQFRLSLSRMRDYFVYILSNNSQVLYIGVTSDLDGRMFEHVRDRKPTSFTARYNLDRLVFYETYPTPCEAIAREKQLKGWTRERKKKLIKEMNPMWKNLLDDLKEGMMELPEGR